MLNNDFESSRAKKLAKRRKTNLILNGLIVLVVLLIFFVSVNIFFGDSQSEAREERDPVTESKEVADTNSSGSGNVEKTEKADTAESTTEEEEQAAEEVSGEESEPVVTAGGSSPDVKQTMINPDWKPVGTSQTGPHQAVYDNESVDWQEMLTAISYATGIDVNNMTVWFLGNNGGPQQAAGTVSEKGGSTKYRVAIEWIDDEGWKPVKVEELTE